MKNPTGNKLDKLIFGMFDQMIEGVDQYNHSGSLWLIFTDEKQWVVEYTVGGTLWYNYKLFKNEMELIGMDCVDNKEYITRWFRPGNHFSTNDLCNVSFGKTVLPRLFYIFHSFSL